MIITRSPLRITLGGGGTDLPSYYEKHSGFLIAAAIDKYIYITVHETFQPEFIYQVLLHGARGFRQPDCASDYSRSSLCPPTGSERVSGNYIHGRYPGRYRTGIVRKLHDGSPQGTAHALQEERRIAAELAEQACDIEINRLREPIGKQDQYIAAYGGITCFQYCPDGRVTAWPLRLSEETRYDLEDNLLLFFTGYSRAASHVLKEQDDKSRSMDSEMIDNLHFVKDLAKQSQRALEGGDLREFARLMHVHWEHKKRRSASMSNGKIDQCYDLAMANGALGGKLIGAGGGGFLMFYTEDKVRLRQAMRSVGLKEVRFNFHFQGTSVMRG